MKVIINKIFNFLQQNTFIFPIIIAIISYLLIFGIQSLDIFNQNFVLRNSSPFEACFFSPEDINIHYLGSVFYRLDDFHAKIFFSQNLAYPFGTSILNTDSIPLLALVFKILYKFFKLSPFTQYFGIWTLFCLIMQGIFALKILEKLKINRLNSIIGSIFFIISPIMLARAFEHSALCAHFFILAGIYLYIKEYTKYKNEIYWTILFACMFMTQPNFFPFLFGIFLADYYKKLFITKEINWKYFSIFLVGLLLINYLIIFKTGLLIGDATKAFGYEYFSTNLNFLINPNGYSLFLPDMPLGTFGQYEGVTYLGLGGILLLILSILIFPKINKEINLKNDYAFIMVLILLFIYSLSNFVFINKLLLFSYPIPKFMEYIYSVFRTTGRGCWLLWYTIFFFCIFSINKNFSSKKATIILLIALLIQIVDLVPIYKLKRLKTDFYSKKNFESILKSDKWNNEYKKYDGVFIIGDTNDNILYYKFFWYWCIKNNKHINYGYFSRYPKETVNMQNKYLTEIKSGKIPDEKLIYVFSENIYNDLKNASKNNSNLVPIMTNIYNESNLLYVLAPIQEN